MRVGIVGSRRRSSMSDRYQVFGLLEHLLDHGDSLTLTIVSGGCRRGADSFAEAAAKAYGVPMAIHLPNLSEGHPMFPAEPYFKRNRKIVEDSDVIYAWVSDDRTGGTENTIGHALNLGRPVYLVRPDGSVYLSKDGAFPTCAPVMHL